MDKAGCISRLIGHVPKTRTTRPDGWKYRTKDKVSGLTRCSRMCMGITQYNDDCIEDIRQQCTAVLLHSAVRFLHNIFVNVSGICSYPAGSTSTSKLASDYSYFCLHTCSPHAGWQHFSHFLTNLLKGNLKCNPTVTMPFFDATSHLVDTNILEPFIRDLFALTVHTAPAFDGWVVAAGRLLILLVVEVDG
ncbi:hypothetical protein DFH08DRAFT_827749 [Mycena albidolilacea]|uniref:Uncharacterized protein n=1 Tax=Mycena albidolilacea TaxID=1033008 RepID=A0AAD6YYD4_9AGAR|nr:hypothetical protein DFH08DRAFT_827749 [Mycena albidolilacea]